MKVDPRFNFLPGIVWAMLIDATDFIPNILTTLASYGIPGVGTIAGWGVDLGWDVVQMSMAIVIFKGDWRAVLNTDLVLPPPLDLFPSYTALYVYYNYIQT